MMPKVTKSTTTHPRSGRVMKIDTAICEPFKAAIIQSLKGSKGKTFSQLSEEVERIIKKKMPGFDKSVSWYTISIRLDLETSGVVETFTENGKKLNRLKK
jgi:hypothetical protein